MNPNDVKKLFKPFPGISSYGTAGERNTGLGLSIAKKIVDAHSGEIWVESMPQLGSSFCISLPLKSSELK
jgi:signal transduction histidine kinase